MGLSVGEPPLDRQRREGVTSSTALQLQLPPPLQPILQPQSGMTSEDRLAILESMMTDVRADLQDIRDSMRNVLRAANEVGEDAQQATLRVDDLEYEWRQWNNEWHNEATPPEPQHV